MVLVLNGDSVVDLFCMLLFISLSLPSLPVVFLSLPPSFFSLHVSLFVILLPPFLSTPLFLEVLFCLNDLTLQNLSCVKEIVGSYPIRRNMKFNHYSCKKLTIIILDLIPRVKGLVNVLVFMC